MHCKKCGADVNNSAFCPNCSTKVETETVVEQVVVAENVNPEPESTGSNPGKVLGIIGMALGIQSLATLTICLCCCIYPVYGWIAYAFIAFFGLASAIVGLILSTKAIKSSAEAGFENKMANVGKILSIISLVVATAIIFILVLLIIMVIALIGVVGSSSAMINYY